MAKFDPDFSIFGTLAGDIKEGLPIDKTLVDYVNTSCIKLYGDLRDREVGSIFGEILGDEKKKQILLSRFLEEGKISFEGKLAGKFVKFHSRIIDCRDDDACDINLKIG